MFVDVAPQGGKRWSDDEEDKAQVAEVQKIPASTEQKNGSDPQNLMLEEIEERLSFYWVIRVAVLNTAGHGFPKLYSDSQRIRRVYAVLCIGFTVLFLYQSAELMIDFLRYPTTLSVTEVNLNRADFPAITFCNANKMRKTEVKKLPADDPLRTVEIYEALAQYQAKVQFDSTEGSVERECSERLQCVIDGYNEMTRGDDYHLANYTDDKICISSFGPVFYQEGPPADDEPDTVMMAARDERDFAGLECGSGECIPDWAFCDGVSDCEDGSDESDLYCGFCQRDQFNCADGGCIDGRKRCDGAIDCGDASDEYDIYCNSSLRDADLFYCCNSLQAIPFDFTCDGLSDCYGDDSDENLQGCGGFFTTKYLSCWIRTEDAVGIPAPENATFGMTTTLGPGRQRRAFAPPPNSASSTTTGYWGSSTSTMVPLSQRWTLVWIPPSYIDDGVPYCKDGLDETCAWKTRLWSSPFEAEAAERAEDLVGSDWITRDGATRGLSAANETQIKSVGHQWEHGMKVMCSFAGDSCDDIDIQVEATVSEQFGNCYTLQTNFMVERAGPANGFTLLMNAEAYEYLSFLSSGASINLLVTESHAYDRRGNLFIDFTRPIHLRPGSEHHIQISMTRRVNLPAPYSECAHYGGRHDFFSKHQCQVSCVNVEKAQQCGCVDDVDYASTEDAPFCQAPVPGTTLDCLEEVERSSNCQCADPCEQLQFSVNHVTSNWPIQSALGPLLLTLDQRVNSSSGKDFLDSILAPYSTGAGDDALSLFGSSFFRVKIYLEDMRETQEVERPVYDAVTVMSTIGGLLGLYLGFSMMSLFELVDAFLMLADIPQMKKQLAKWRETEAP